MTYFEYQKKQRFFAQIAGNSEKIGAQELQEIGANDIEIGYRGAYFNADQATLYKINYTSRIITRVLAPIDIFSCPNTDVLYDKAIQIPWEEFFGLDQTFAIYANINIKSSQIYHSKYASLKLKDAIVDRFRDRKGKRPNVDTNRPDVVFNLYIQNDEATISLDTSGESLHKRGYRLDSGEAPIQETVAAAILRLSEWQGENTIYDPMCGSGTLLCEALMKYCRIPAGYLRGNYGFKNLPDFDKDLWQKVKNSCDAKIRKLEPGLIKGSDISSEMIKIARRNCARLPYGDSIILSVKPFQKIKSLQDMTIVVNPPFGVRMSKKELLKKLYTEFSKGLKAKAQKSKVLIYCGKPELLDYIWMREDWKRDMVNGGLEGKLVQYRVY
ncbi:MAG: class I SAM-dependent RNA methyltransferase [Candidatus Marinimicrobia bacterium]|nr:class I SAM-dependent RNA methyltransferase [Candidatus Neomarinimicrobiota bacterium]